MLRVFISLSKTLHLEASNKNLELDNSNRNIFRVSKEKGIMKTVSKFWKVKNSSLQRGSIINFRCLSFLCSIHFVLESDSDISVYWCFELFSHYYLTVFVFVMCFIVYCLVLSCVPGYCPVRTAKTTPNHFIPSHWTSWWGNFDHSLRIWKQWRWHVQILVGK